MNSEQSRDQGLDLFRCLAILSVLLLHAQLAIPVMPQALKKLFSFGWLGVDIFFVLSGFLIGRQALWGKRAKSKLINLRNFWVKRWFRTLPLYFFVLFFYIAIKPLVFGYSFKDEVWPFFLFLQNYTQLTDYVQSWSLCIEEQFYLVLPLLTFVFIPKFSKKIYPWVFFLLFALFVRYMLSLRVNIMAMTPEQVDGAIRFPIYTHLDGLAMGVFLAATHRKWSVYSEKIKLGCALVGVAIVALTMYCSGPALTMGNGVFYFFNVSIGFALMLIYIQGKSLPSFVSPGIFWISILSYGTYLWNNSLIKVFQKLDLPLHWLAQLILFLGIVHVLAWVTYSFVEKPFMNLRTRYLRD